MSAGLKRPQFPSFDDSTHHQLRRRGTLSRRPAGADFGDRGERVSNCQPTSVQNKQLASPRISLGRSSRGWVRVGDPASRSWLPVRLSGACGPAGALSAAVRKDLNLNLSAVHEQIRGRAYGQRFRNWFRVKASGSRSDCFKSGAVACAPPIVRDESSRVFLGGALQQSPPLRRPSSTVGQFSLEVHRKDEPAVRGRALLPSSKPAEMRAFYSGADKTGGSLHIASGRSLPSVARRQLAGLDPF